MAVQHDVGEMQFRFRGMAGMCADSDRQAVLFDAVPQPVVLLQFLQLAAVSVLSDDNGEGG